MIERRKANHIAQALSELNQQFRAPLIAYFTKRVGDQSEAEDLTQEAFIRLVRHPDGQQLARIHAYVFTIAANLLRDRNRRRLSHRYDAHTSLDADLEQFSDSLGGDFTPERVLIGKETLQGVIRALSELDERTRDMFILSRLENIPHRDIAAAYGISVKAVEKRIAKALAYLGGRISRK
jgi:RNA polymerase sigma factor (sigma-70 family)